MIKTSVHLGFLPGEPGGVPDPESPISPNEAKGHMPK